LSWEARHFLQCKLERQDSLLDVFSMQSVQTANKGMTTHPERGFSKQHSVQTSVHVATQYTRACLETRV